VKVREILKSLNIEPKKSKGQNFLLNDSTVKSIIDFSGLASIVKMSASTPVLEIGPGIGALSSEILSYTKNFALIELESKFCNYLISTHQDLNPELVLNSNFNKIDLAEVCKKLNTYKVFVISNVPYSVSSEFFLWLIKNREYISRASLLFQREFSQRLAAKPDSKQYGSLSILCKTFCKAKLGNIISGQSFYPSAEVESRLIKLDFRKELEFDIHDFNTFEKVIRAAFSHRRKTIYNSIKFSGLFRNDVKGDESENIKEYLELANFDLKKRAENFSAKDYSRLTGVVLGKIKN